MFNTHTHICITSFKCQEVNTYTFNFQFSEETPGHEHPQRDGEDEYEGKCEGYWTGLNNPQNCKAQYLDGREQVHSSCAHLQPTCGNISQIDMTAHTRILFGF